MTALCFPLAPGPAADRGRAIVRLAPTDMADAALKPGDIVRLSGGKETLARVLPSMSDPGKLRADGITAANAGSNWGDLLSLSKADVPELKHVVLQSQLPVSAKDVAPALRDMALSAGDRHILEVEPNGGSCACQTLELLVQSLDPPGAGKVVSTTKVDLRPVQNTTPTYPGIAGLEPQIAALHEMVELPLERPDLFERLQLAPPRGVLFTGPPGSGKTLLARALAERTSAAFFQIAGPEIVSKHYGETERALRDVFEAAARKSPAIIFIDEIDAIAPQREALSGEKQVERRTVGQLLTLLDGLEARDQVVVIAATNLPNALDPALRRPGRFEREIAFTPPDVAARQKILALHLAKAPVERSVDLRSVATRCMGYLGADLAAVARETGLAALARARHSASNPAEIDAETVFLAPEDFETAIARTRPSLLRADAYDAAPPDWSDVGGQDAKKEALNEAVILPLKHQDAFSSLGLAPTRGILLAGLPGTGKTLMARALATEAGMNFVPVQASGILSQFLGEAERAVEAAFRRARLAAPALLFFDELDALSPRRGVADATTDRITAQLLTEIDGLQPNAGITVIAATNRPERIDPALLRAGRFDMTIRMELPDMQGRADILAIHTRTRSLAPDVDLESIARETEGATPAELHSLISDAARKALSRWRKNGRPDMPCIDPEDLMKAIEVWRTREVDTPGDDTEKALQSQSTRPSQLQPPKSA